MLAPLGFGTSSWAKHSVGPAGVPANNKTLRLHFGSFASRVTSCGMSPCVVQHIMPAFSPPQRVILVVDDCEADILLLERALKKSGLNYPIQSVPGGLEALAYLNGDPPFHDRTRYPLPLLVLLDARMPIFDGFEVIAWIRKNPELADLAVVMLTGSNQIEDANKAYQLGASSFFVKAMDFANSAELFRAVERVIAQKRP